jgi:adenine-specific DNA-methyltransferase
MARAKKPAEPMPVESVAHQDKRVNIPTGQQSHLVQSAEDKAPSVLYPRDPSLDPQLVWKGKEEQDAEALSVPAVPIYIQEKIDPRAIIENLRQTAKAGEAEPELTLFNDFDGYDDLDPLERVDFYQHEGNWQNRMILGDSLVVMTSLAEKENLAGKVQMIYIDPPYGISFGSNWQVSTRSPSIRDGRSEGASREPEVVKAFRDTWELGIHSYLTYLRDRLTVARDLLTDTGSVFVQIGDENVHRVRAVMDEVFGDGNFVSQIPFKTTSGAGSFAGGTNVLAAVGNYLVWYAKDIEQVKYRQIYRDKIAGGDGGGQYTWIETDAGERRRMTGEERGSDAPPGRVFRPAPFTSQTTRVGQTTVFPIEVEGKSYVPGKGGWKTNRDGVERLKQANRLMGIGNTLTYVRYLDDFPAFPLTNMWDDTTTSGFSDPKVYVVQTNVKVVQRCMLMTTDPGDLVLDPTCGSGTTALVAEQWGRRWITTDTSRVALALARTRLMSARFPYFLLVDSAAAAEHGVSDAPSRHLTNDVKKGFVLKRIPHVTLKAIANNPDLTDGMSRSEIEAAIAKHSESEVLVDQPVEDRRRVRVSGRFTVESLSPHRMLDQNETDEALAGDPEVEQFETMILDNLRKAGVQNTFKGERLAFRSLQPLEGGEWIQAEGEYEEEDGTVRRVGVAIGPEYGTVGSEQVALAAQEATRGIPYDVLLVTGFAFDPQAWAKAKEINPDVAERSLGRLRVLLVRANPDLSMGDELLKKTGAGNLFTIFGEPDLDIRVEGGEIEVEIRGLDVYDPTTGEVRPASVDDIATWFIDSNYDGTSFFVRHAYFLGGEKADRNGKRKGPYDSLATVLKADIDEEAWSSLYSTTSRKFPVPTTGKIAVKVINHYGDEVLQVYDVSG